MTGLRFRLESIAFRGLLQLTRIVPRRVMRGVGTLLGSVAYAVDGRHRRVTLDNLKQAYGDSLPPAEQKRIAVESWRNFGRNILDGLYFPGFDRSAIGTIVHYEGLEHIREAYARGKGVLIFSGHFGQWELAAMMQGFLDLPLILITRPLDNPDLETLLAEMRSRSGNRVVHKRNAVREMVKAIKQKIGVAIVIDQDAHADGLFVPFYGRPASTTPTLARIALRTGATVVPIFSLPRPDGTYRIVYEAPLDLEPTGDLDADALRITAEATAAIERWVRAHPEHWLWAHRRWKTRPPGEES